MPDFAWSVATRRRGDKIHQKVMEMSNQLGPVPLAMLPLSEHTDTIVLRATAVYPPFLPGGEERVGTTVGSPHENLRWPQPRRHAPREPPGPGPPDPALHRLAPAQSAGQLRRGEKDRRVVRHFAFRAGRSRWDAFEPWASLARVRFPTSFLVRLFGSDDEGWAAVPIAAGVPVFGMTRSEAISEMAEELQGWLDTEGVEWIRRLNHDGPGVLSVPQGGVATKPT